MAKGRATGVFAEHEMRACDSNERRRHDFIAKRVSQHSVLMNPRLVGEGVRANDRLVGRWAEGDDLAEHLACRIELVQLDAAFNSVVVRAHIKGRRDLFQGRVACALADAVYRAFDLACAGGDGGQRIGCGKPKVIVAMRGENDTFRIDGRDALADFAKHLSVFLGGRVTDRIRHVDRGGSGLDGYADHVDQKAPVRASRIFGRELDVVNEGAGKPNRTLPRGRELLDG